VVGALAVAPVQATELKRDHPDREGPEKDERLEFLRDPSARLEQELRKKVREGQTEQVGSQEEPMDEPAAASPAAVRAPLQRLRDRESRQPRQPAGVVRSVARWRRRLLLSAGLDAIGLSCCKPQALPLIGRGHALCTVEPR
jgi:hypothetical protein